MNDLLVSSTSQRITPQYTSSTIETPRDENTNQRTDGNNQKLIPRNQNKVVAERTSDMFMSGLMCE